MNITFSKPDITQAEIDAVVETMQSGWITTGPKTKLFEKTIAEYCNTHKAVCLNSATVAMELTLRLLGIGAGDEVITSSYTYTASASVIDHVGAKIVLVDTAKDSYHMDYEAVKKAINKKTKAIIAVDIAGVPCDYETLFSIAEEKKALFCPENDIQNALSRITIIADAAHSLGARYKGKKVGSIADFTAFSFHAVKNLTTAEGGALTWKTIKGIEDDVIYKQCMLFSLHGQSKDALEKNTKGSWEYDIVAPYYKCNMTDIMAAMGLSQLKRYTDILLNRKKLIAHYTKLLENQNLAVLEHYNNTYTSSGHLFLLRLTDHDEKFRNEVIIQLAEKGIVTNVHYKPLPLLTAYKNLGFRIENFPNAYNQYKNEISLPLYNTLTENEIDYIVHNLKAILESKI